jgi:hypothetical protein
MNTPQFGEKLINPYASKSNPHREGYFIREIKRSGFINPGIYWEFTDKKGNFWQSAKVSFEREATE